MTKLCKCGCNKPTNNNNTYIVGHNRKGTIPWNKGKTGYFTQEALYKMGSYQRNKTGPDSDAWSGGKYSWYHNKARLLYLKECCQKCGKKSEQYDMHCVSQEEEGWKDLSPENWRCICRGCHVTETHKLKKDKV